MSRTLLAWCCAALSCFPSPGRSMTVLPITFSTSTSSPSNKFGNYYHGGGGGKGLYGGGGYNNGGREISGYSYGHRTLSASDVAKVRVGRNEPSHALYESPHTYEYMSDPRKGGHIRQDGTRVPKTEKRPPGDDVEYVVDARPPARDRRRYGHSSRHRNMGGRNGGEEKKRKKKSPSMTTGKRAAEPEVVVSSSKKNVRKDNSKTRDSDKPVYEKKTHAKKNGAKGDADAGNGVRNIREREEIIGDLDAQVKHKVHKKNEYSKKQQFFDEEHVDHGKKKPILNRDHNKKGHKNRASHDNSSRKRKRRVMKDSNKDHRNLEHVKQKSFQGYGQVLAVR